MLHVPYLIDWQLLGLWLLMSLGTYAIWGILSWTLVSILRHGDSHRGSNSRDPRERRLHVSLISDKRPPEG